MPHLGAVAHDRGTLAGFDERCRPFGVGAAEEARHRYVEPRGEARECAEAAGRLSVLDLRQHRLGDTDPLGHLTDRQPMLLAQLAHVSGDRHLQLERLDIFVRVTAARRAGVAQQLVLIGHGGHRRSAVFHHRIPCSTVFGGPGRLWRAPRHLRHGRPPRACNTPGSQAMLVGSSRPRGRRKPCERHRVEPAAVGRHCEVWSSGTRRKLGDHAAAQPRAVG